MIVTQIAHIIADYVVFLQLTDEDNLDPDVAMKITEGLADQLESLDQGFLRKLLDAFAVIAEEYSGEARDVVRNIGLDFYLEDVLAADDPVKLAEIEAMRDARV